MCSRMGLSVLSCVGLSGGHRVLTCCWLGLQERLKCESFLLRASGMMAGSFTYNSEAMKMFSVRLPSRSVLPHAIMCTSRNPLSLFSGSEFPMFLIHWPASLIFGLFQPLCSSLPALPVQRFFLLCSPTCRVTLASSITEVCGHR